MSAQMYPDAHTFKYSEPRITHLETWMQKPTVDSNMRTTVAFPFECHERDVQLTTGERYQLWSPNDAYLPPFPGSRPSDYKFPHLWSYQLLDGTSGKFDAGFYPQVLKSPELHLAFMPRPPIATQDEEHLLRHHPEFSALKQYWRVTGLATGRPSALFVAALKQKAAWLETMRSKQIKELHIVDSRYREFPSVLDIDVWVAETFWEESIDRIAAIQYAMKEKWAYYNYYRVKANPIAKSTTLKALGCNAKYMGCWANALTQKEVDFLLRNSVGVYFVHQYVAGIDFGHGLVDCRARKAVGDFFFASHLFLVDKFEPKLAASGVRLDDLHIELHSPHPGTTSGSRSHGHVREPRNCLSAELQPLHILQHAPTLKQQQQPRVTLDDMEAAEGEEDPPSAKATASSRLLSVSGGPTPPPIQACPPGRTWIWYSNVPIDDDDSDVPKPMTWLNKRQIKELMEEYEHTPNHVWYDRQKAQGLIFKEPPPTYEYDVSDKWGQPCPEIKWFRSGEPARPSKWMYKNKDVQKHLIGLAYDQPNPEQSVPRPSAYVVSGEKVHSKRLRKEMAKDAERRRKDEEKASRLLTEQAISLKRNRDDGDADNQEPSNTRRRINSPEVVAPIAENFEPVAQPEQSQKLVGPANEETELEAVVIAPAPTPAPTAPVAAPQPPTPAIAGPSVPRRLAYREKKANKWFMRQQRVKAREEAELENEKELFAEVEEGEI